MAGPAPEHRTKRELAVAKVKGAIMAGRYRPRQALRQAKLMADLGLGATPAREAALELGFCRNKHGMVGSSDAS